MHHSDANRAAGMMSPVVAGYAFAPGTRTLDIRLMNMLCSD
jgi:hypothetical protein